MVERTEQTGPTRSFQYEYRIPNNKAIEAINASRAREQKANKEAEWNARPDKTRTIDYVDYRVGNKDTEKDYKEKVKEFTELLGSTRYADVSATREYLNNLAATDPAKYNKLVKLAHDIERYEIENGDVLSNLSRHFGKMFDVGIANNISNAASRVADYSTTAFASTDRLQKRLVENFNNIMNSHAGINSISPINLLNRMHQINDNYKHALAAAKTIPSNNRQAIADAKQRLDAYIKMFKECDDIVAGYDNPNNIVEFWNAYLKNPISPVTEVSYKKIQEIITNATPVTEQLANEDMQQRAGGQDRLFPSFSQILGVGGN